jgi:tetratricopeptide (TPR) repeat protein
MIKEKSLQDVTASLRELYNRATAAGRKKNWDYAIELMLNVLAKEPTLGPAREELRNYERGKAESLGFITKIAAKIKASFKVPKLKIVAKKDPFKAIREYEKLLGEYLYNPAVLNALADAAVSKNVYFIGIEALEIIREKHPDNEANLRKLAEYYKETKDGMAYLRVFQQIASKHPNDLKRQSELRAATAFSTMHKSNWESEGSTQEKAENAASEQIAEGSIHDSSQAKILIEKYEKELQEKESTDIRRKLAEAYCMVNEYEKAIENLDVIQKNLGAIDPSIDKQIEAAYIANIDCNIKELSENPDQYEEPEKQIRDLQQHRLHYRLKRAEKRSETYPNDTQLRYDLAMIYFEINEFDKALEAFQKARKNPQRRRSCIIHIGRCLESKGQFDMAIDQFKEALAEMLEMSKEKLETLYYLAIAYEATEDSEKALSCFKEIYQTNVNYKDVAERIQKHYT